MYYFVYFLKSIKQDKIYIGFTTNLKRRLIEHNKANTGFTARHKPWRLVYFEYYSSKKDAIIRERQLKRFAKAYGQLKRRIKNSLEGS